MGAEHMYPDIEELHNGEWRTRMSENKELLEALSRAQGKVENAKKNSENPHFKNNYADLATIWDTIREPLTSEGLSVIQLPCEAPDGKVGLVTIIGHKSGHTISERFYLGLKNASNPQDAGSCLTYMKRYALLGVAGIAPEDDDGNAAAGRPSPTRPAVDYSKTIAETMKKLSDATDEEARGLYAAVRAGDMETEAKNALLRQMADVIQARMAKTEEAAPKKTKKDK